MTSRSWSCQRLAGSASTSLIRASNHGGSASPVFSGVHSLHGRKPAARASRALLKGRLVPASPAASPQSSVQKIPVLLLATRFNESLCAEYTRYRYLFCMLPTPPEDRASIAGKTRYHGNRGSRTMPGVTVPRLFCPGNCPPAYHRKCHSDRQARRRGCGSTPGCAASIRRRVSARFVPGSGKGIGVSRCR